MNIGESTTKKERLNKSLSEISETLTELKNNKENLYLRRMLDLQSQKYHVMVYYSERFEINENIENEKKQYEKMIPEIKKYLPIKEEDSK